MEKYMIIVWLSIKKNDVKVRIICSKHGLFEQVATSHLRGRGCPKCKLSKGEKEIMKFLNKYKIEFNYQKTFDECVNILPLKFDFYLPQQNLLIEFDGEQHNNVSDFFGGVEGLIYRKKNDEIKNDFARQNNIELLRIEYNDYRSNRIEKILKHNLNLN